MALRSSALPVSPADSEGEHLPALDSDAWVAFLDPFLQGSPGLHLEVQDTVADEDMNAQRILSPEPTPGPSRLPPTGHKLRFGGLELGRMVDGKAATTASRWPQSRCSSSSACESSQARDCCHGSRPPITTLSRKWRR